MVSEPPVGAILTIAFAAVGIVSIPIIAYLAYRGETRNGLRRPRSPYACPSCGIVGTPADAESSDRGCTTPIDRCRVISYRIGRNRVDPGSYSVEVE